MRTRIALALLVLAAALVPLSASEERVDPIADFMVHMRVPTVDSLRIVATPTVGTNNSPILYTVWLNLSGGGSIQYAWVNLTFDSDLVPDASSANTPSGCTRGANTTWQCNGLRQGTHVWTVPAKVSGNPPTTNRTANTTASVRTYSNRQYSALMEGAAGVWISGVLLGLDVVSHPVDMIRLREQVRFTVIVSSDGDNNTDTAHDVVVRVDVSPGLRPQSIWQYGPDNVTPGSSLSFSFDFIVEDNATVGDPVWIVATLTYADPGGHLFGPIEVTHGLLVQSAEIVSPTNFVAGVLVGGVAILLGIAGLLIAGQQRIRIDELFLVHSSGALIQHVSRTSTIKKDDDLMAAMLVAVQAFVRDSLKREDTLDEFDAGPRRATIVRGKHVVLAAVISRGSAAYLLPQLRAAVHAIETAHGPILANWDGRLSRLTRAEPILDTLLRGGYRREAWTEWVGGTRRFLRLRRHR